MRRSPIESRSRWQTGWAGRWDSDMGKLFSMSESSRKKHEKQQTSTATR